jgi:hypothetical protein
MGWWWLDQRGEQARAQAQMEFFEAVERQDLDEIERVARDHESVSNMAWFYHGALIFDRASRQGGMQDQSAYLGQVKQARQSLQQAEVEEYSPLITPAARLLLANAIADQASVAGEQGGAGEAFDQARSLYKKVIDDPRAEKIYVELAQERLAALDRGDLAISFASPESMQMDIPRGPTGSDTGLRPEDLRPDIDISGSGAPLPPPTSETVDIPGLEPETPDESDSPDDASPRPIGENPLSIDDEQNDDQ